MGHAISNHDAVVEAAAFKVAMIEQRSGRLPVQAIVTAATHLNINQIPVATRAVTGFAVGQQVAIERGYNARYAVTVIATLPGRKKV